MQFHSFYSKNSYFCFFGSKSENTGFVTTYLGVIWSNLIIFDGFKITTNIKKIKGQPNFSTGIILGNNRIWDRLPDSHDFICILVNNVGLERSYWEIPKSAVFIHPSKLSTLENNCYFEPSLLRYHVLKSSCKTEQIIFFKFFFAIAAYKLNSVTGHAHLFLNVRGRF